jgi:hypothetical protein
MYNPFFNPSAVWGMNAQRHALASLPPVEDSRYLLLFYFVVCNAMDDVTY